MDEDRAHAKSVASLRLSEQIARLSRDASSYDTVEMSSPRKKREQFDIDATVNAQAPRPHSRSWAGVSQTRIKHTTPTQQNLADAIEADLVLGGSLAEVDLLKIIARRLSSNSDSRSRHSRTSSVDALESDDLTPRKSQSRFARFSQSLRRSTSKSTSDTSDADADADATNQRKMSYSQTVGGSVTCRYCLDKMNPRDNCSSCMCQGFLCQSCLEGELQLTFSRANRVMHCTVCRHVFTIADMKELKLPVPRFPRCVNANGECMRTSVVLPIMMWTVFTGIYSFIDPDFSIIRGDVFFIAELATMAFSLHFCWKSSELTRDWLRFLYATRAIRSLVVVILVNYTWIDTIFLIFSIIFVLGSCLRRPGEQGHRDQRYVLEVYVNEIGPMKLDQPDEWVAAPTSDMIVNNQERAAAEREVQIARRRLGESLSDGNRQMLSEDEIQTRADAMARFLGFGRELDDEERLGLERELEEANVATAPPPPLGGGGRGDNTQVGVVRQEV